MSQILIFSVILLAVIVVHDAANILAVFPTPSISHQVVFRPLTQELAKRGHQVVVITTDPAFQKGQAPANLREIDVHDLSYNMWRKFFETTSGKKEDHFVQLITGLDLQMKILEKQLQTNEIQVLIGRKNDTFDLLLIEACSRPALAFSHIFNAPVIQVSSLGPMFDTYDTIGAPTHPFIYPTFIQQKIYNLTLWEKVTELYNHYKYRNCYYSHEAVENEMLKRVLGSEVPTLQELSKKVELLLLNTHQLWEGSSPVPPGVVYIWGTHKKQQKELSKDLKSYLDSSKNGVIYISFGTNINPSMLPKDKIEILVKVFSQLPYDVLWKWDKDELPGRSNNIRISKWLPQSDLLHHPNVKLFITQGGIQSTDEAMTAGVPLIGMPMLADQWYNVEKYLYYKIGLRLDMETLTETKFKHAIDTVINDVSYSHNVARLRSLMLEQAQRPVERGVWWVEHMVRHKGAKHLRAPAANISWAEYLELELLGIGLICLLILISLSAFIIQTAFLYITVSKKKSKYN